MIQEPVARPASKVVPSTVWFGPSVPEPIEEDFKAFLGSHHGVAVLMWPRDREHGAHLDAVGIPRLVLVPPDVSPPPRAPLQQWLPAAAGHDQIHDALVGLARIAELRRLRAGAPTFDADCVLHLGDGSVEVPAADAGVVEILVDNYEQPVDTVLLASPEPDASVLHGRLRRLARQLSCLGLEIVPVADDAFVLRRCASCDHPVTPVVTQTPAEVPATPRVVGRRRTLPMHFRSGLLAPDLP